MSACPGKASSMIVLLFVCSLLLITSASGDTPPAPIVYPEPINLTTMPIIIHHTGITPFPTTLQAPAGPVVFSGRVVRGESWETAGPVAGLTVICHCSDDPQDPGPVVASAVTDAGGGYTLTVTDRCQFYTLAPAGDPPADADSKGGTVLPGGSIRYEEPLGEKSLDLDRFFFAAGDYVAPDTSSEATVPAGTRFAPSTPLPGVLVIFGIFTAGCVAIMGKK